MGFMLSDKQKLQKSHNMRRKFKSFEKTKWLTRTAAGEQQLANSSWRTS